MRQIRKQAAWIVLSAGFLALILDSKTALRGASDGILLCIKTVIPSLFPFFLVSKLLTAALTGAKIGILRPVCKFCKIPEGAESIFLIGILGGYPIGAQCIHHAYTSNQISKSNAQRMLGFCNNAGPAFLFGMVGQLFEHKLTVMLLWAIHVASAIITGIILPNKPANVASSAPAAPISIGHAMQQSLWAMGSVCGWVIIFRVILNFANHWFLWLLPPNSQHLISGVLELSNGCIDLFALNSQSTRFILSALFLAFGGVCVLMQTTSVVSPSGLGLGMYIPGKLLQSAFSCMMAIPTANLLFPNEPKIHCITLLLPAVVAVTVRIFLKYKENNSSIPTLTGV